MLQLCHCISPFGRWKRRHGSSYFEFRVTVLEVASKANQFSKLTPFGDDATAPLGCYQPVQCRMIIQMFADVGCPKMILSM
jgi:hypothetical protein